MRLARYEGTDGVARLGALTDDGVVNLASAANILGLPGAPFTEMASFLSAGESALDQARKLVQTLPQGTLIPTSDIKLRKPVPFPGKIIAIIQWKRGQNKCPRLLSCSPNSTPASQALEIPS